ncbi:pleiotropic drug resistance protein 3-like protein [Carex littledalei]|uniref:Pleiotropic drug resistance protein 3-like protein n=1 Tax=Carex littledalei TaxID=544730 RepID=A0A833RMT2_9POAL|nr:pleiotropic drug resistance protein 3-like protein [Carex littledalei]
MDPSLGEGLSRLGSLGQGGSIWRQTGDVFSRSSREEDDEEALCWAALEKLPTYDRAKRAILTSASGKINVVDVENLGVHEKKALLDRLIRAAEEDNERFLIKLKERCNRVGIELPTIEVRYKNLSIDAETHVGNRGLPTVVNATMNIIESMANSLHILPSRKRKMSILHDVSGIIKPCRMTLILGPPGSGKTTLLLALAGKLGSDLKVSGEVTYNGHEMNEFVPERSAAYISQHDFHIGELTVRETLAFSARCQGVGSRYDMLTELLRREKAANIKPDLDIDLLMKASAMGGQEATVVTDYIIKILGLDICADTMVGNDMIRGISGGQRKRVTTGEMLVGPANALFMDEISTGLDSSTTFQIVNSIRQSIHILQGTAVISLLQPAPETYELFDDIILISDGQVVYHGPRDNVLEFFESVGFKCPERKGVADFLQEVTSRKDQQQYWVRSDKPYRYVPVKKFAEAYKSFHVGRAMRNELAVPFDRSKSHPAALTTSKYGVSTKELLKAQIDREILLIKRNSFVYIYLITQLTIIALATMTVFLRTRMHRDASTDGNKFFNALFFGALMIMFNGFSEMAMTIIKLPVFFKQRDLLFFPAWTYTIPGWIVKIPIAFVEVFVWVFMTYYVIGFDPNVGRLFKQYLVLILTTQMSGGLFRFMGGLARDMVVANTFGSFAILIVVALGGFLLTRESIKKWWIWGYWISPLMYVQNAISVNEFTGHSWDKIVNGERIGTTFMNSRGIFAESRWYWIGCGALIGFILLFNSLYTLVATFLEPYGKDQPSMSEKMLKEKHENLTGEILEGSSRGKRSSSLHRSSRHGSSIRNNSTSAKSAREIIGSDKKGMVLPFTPLSLTFDDIKYSVDMPQVSIVVTCICLILVFDIMTKCLCGHLLKLHPKYHHKRNKALIRDLSVPQPGSSDVYFASQYSQPFFTQCMACLWKQHLSYWRNPSYTAVRFFFTLVCALLLGSIFWQLGNKTKTQTDLLNSLGSMYIATLLIGFQNSSMVMPAIIELPYVFAQALTYSLVVYAMIGFDWTAPKFFWYLYFSYLTLLYFTFYGMMCVGFTPNYNVATIVSAAFFGLWNLFSGFIITKSQIPGWWIWYYWISPVAWTLYGLVVSQYGDITESMEDGTQQAVKDFVESYFGFKHDFLPVVAVVVLGFSVLFSFLFGFAILKLNFQKR